MQFVQYVIVKNVFYSSVNQSIYRLILSSDGPVPKVSPRKFKSDKKEGNQTS